VSAAELPQLLRRLHAELQHTASLDAESRDLLNLLARDLAKFETQGSTTRELAVRFEADHPAMASTLRQIADLLGKAGI
jgi:hypothetical protein